MNSSTIQSRTTSTANTLRTCRPFERLDADDLDCIADRCRPLEFQRGEMVFAEGDPSNSLYLVVEGTVRLVTMTESGKEIALGYFKVWDLFGESVLADVEQRDHGAFAATETKLIEIDAEFITSLMGENPGFAASFSKLMCSRLGRSRTRMQNLMYRSPRQRLASILLELAGDFGQQRPGSGEIEIGLRITHQEMASLIGTTRESVSYAMGGLELDEMIRTAKRRIFLTDAQALSQLSC